MKKITCFFLSVFMGTVLGCARQNTSSSTVTIWHWMTDRDSAFQELARRYEEQTGIKVRFDLYAPSDYYTERIVAAAQAKVLPDVYGVLDKKEFFASFIKNGYVVNLTEEFEKDNGFWEKSLFPKALDVNRFPEGNVYGVKPGIYGVPLDVTNIQMVYNKKLFKKAGLVTPPETFDEFLAAADALNRVGVSPFVSGWGEKWMVECFALNYAFNIMGEEKVMATYRGEVPYTDPDWIKVFSVFKTLRDRKVFLEGIVTKANKYAEQDFALGRAAFAFNGSWCVNVYHDMNPDLEYGTMLPPAINPSRPMLIWGGAGSSFVVNNHSPREEKAIAFLKWLSAKEQQIYLSTKTKNLPSNKEAGSFVPGILSSFSKEMDKTTHPSLWSYNEIPQVVERFAKGIQAIIIGDKTPEEAAREIQKKKEEELRRKAKRRKGE